MGKAFAVSPLLHDILRFIDVEKMSSPLQLVVSNFTSLPTPTVHIVVCVYFPHNSN